MSDEHPAVQPTPADLTLIDMRAITPASQGFADRHGLSLDILSRIGSDTILAHSDDAYILPHNPDEEAFNAKLFQVTHSFKRRDYMHPFFVAHGLVVLDPFTRTRLVSTHSLMIDHLHIAYRFTGQEIFYLLVGGIGGIIRFCSIPRLNCLIAMRNFGEDDAHVEWSVGVNRRLLTGLAQHEASAAQAFRHPRRATGVAIGFSGNFGHTIWQDFAGLEEIIRLQGADVIGHILAGPQTFVPVGEIFPELADREVTVIEGDVDPIATSLALPYQHLRPIGALIPAGLRQRFVRAARAHSDAAVLRRIAAIGQQRILVWITLRANLKVWLRQVSGHIEVLRRLAQEVGPIAVVLDGWNNTRADADAIREGVEPYGVEVIDILGCGVYEQILWAEASDVYSAVVGSVMFINSYFANRPGFAHGNRVHMDQAAFWTERSPGSRAPTFLDPAMIQDEKKLFDNYDFDPNLLYEGLLRIITSEVLPGRRPNAA